MSANPVPNSESTRFKAGEKQVEIARKGGIASGEAKRLKKSMKQALIEVLETENSKGISYQELVTLGLVKGAIKGKARNYNTIINIAGSDELNRTPNVEIKIVNNEHLSKVINNEED